MDRRGNDDGGGGNGERPAWEADFMEAAASHLANVGGQMTSLIQHDYASGRAPSEGAFAAFVAPLDVTSRVKRQIAALPRSERSPTWMVHIDTDETDEGSGLTCTVHQVTKEHGSNGKILGESDGLGMSLAMCGLLDETRSMTTRHPLLLGTLAKACLHPGGPMGVPMPMPLAAPMFQPSKPRKVLFQTRGEAILLTPDLAEMGIPEVGVADRALIRSVELQASSMNNLSVGDAEGFEEFMHSGDVSDSTTVRRFMGQRVMANHRAQYEPYVSEERVPLGSWKPPSSDPGDLPARWYARPPDDPNNWRPTELLGWRTNLERAALCEDVGKIKEIVAKRDASDVREYVECRMLLTKVAQRGLIDACEALIDDCGASVEGAQAPDAEPWWLPIQDKSGNSESLTPLHQAARNGQTEVVLLLLDRGADVNRVDKAKIRGSALHHAVSMGETDCVRLLCENGADLTYKGMGGEALDISELCAGGDPALQQVQEKVRRILREFDSRCSCCRTSNPRMKCPCGKERYCDKECQRGRWKKHKKYHKSLVGEGKKK